MVPPVIERRIQNVLECRTKGTDIPYDKDADIHMDSIGEALVPMPARVAQGSSPMHRDTGFNKFDEPDPGYVEGYVAVLYLEGFGTLVVDSGTRQHSIEVKPNRLIVWPNDACLHRLDASQQGGSRRMLGPMSLKAGSWQRAGDQYAAILMEKAYKEQAEEQKAHEEHNAQVEAEKEKAEKERQAEKEREQKFVLALAEESREDAISLVSCTDLAGTNLFQAAIHANASYFTLRNEIVKLAQKERKIEFPGQLVLMVGDDCIDNIPDKGALKVYELLKSPPEGQPEIEPCKELGGKDHEAAGKKRAEDIQDVGDEA